MTEIFNPSEDSNAALTAIATEINKSIVDKFNMAIGKRLTHPDGYMVEVISGQYLDSAYNRFTNYWSWKRVNEDGSLQETIESGYGW